MSTKKCSIIIVNYNVADLLIECVKSINSTESDLILEIIVVDNNSNNDDKKKLMEIAAQQKIRLVLNFQNVGFAAANNQVLSDLNSDYVVFLNPDTKIIEPYTFDRLISVLESSEKIGVCGPKILFGDGTLQLSCGSYPTPLRFLSELLYLTHFFPKLFPGYRYSNWQHNHRKEVDWVSGACLVIKYNVLKMIFGFDDMLSFYMEDVDLCTRVIMKGYKIIYEPSVYLIHFEGQSSRQTRETAVITGYFSKLKFYSKYHRKSTVELIRIGFIASTILKLIVLFPFKMASKKYGPLFNSYYVALRQLLVMGRKKSIA